MDRNHPENSTNRAENRAKSCVGKSGLDKKL